MANNSEKRKLVYHSARIGIDISDYSIEVLALNKRGSVLGYGRSILGSGMVSRGEVVRPEELTRVLLETLKKARPQSLQTTPKKRVKAVLNLPESKAFSRSFKIEGEKVSQGVFEAIKEDMGRYIPLEFNDVYWDYVVFPPNGKKDQERRVIYAVCPKKVINQYLEVLEKAEVEPVAFTLEAASLGRALLPSEIDRLDKKDPSESGDIGIRAVIDLGAYSGTVNLFSSEGVLLLSVMIPTAGQYFTKQVASFLGVSMAEAEQKKKDVGLRKKGKESKVSKVLEKAAEQLASEARKAIEHGEKELGQYVQSIVLAGGTSLLPGLDEYLAEKLGRETSIGNPLSGIDASKLMQSRKVSVLFGNVVGLARRSVKNPFCPNELNLLPEDRQRIEKRVYTREKTSVKVFAWTIFVGGLLLLLAVALTLFFL